MLKIWFDLFCIGLKSVELGLAEKPGIRLSAKHKGDVCNDSDLRGMKHNHAMGERMGSGSSASDVHMHDVMMVRPHNGSCVSRTKLSSKKTSSTKSDVKKKLSESSTNLKHASILGEKADESSSRSAGEGANENLNQLSVSGIRGTKEENTVLRSNSESDHRAISEIQSKVRANSEASSDAEMMPINRDLYEDPSDAGKPDLNHMKGVEGNKRFLFLVTLFFVRCQKMLILYKTSHRFLEENFIPQCKISCEG